MARERDVLEVDVLFVGAGPASLAGAIRLAQLYQEHNAAVKSGAKTGPELSTENILVIEKSRNIGDHALSGAVLDPRSMRELFGDFLAAGCPVESPVTTDAFWLMSKSSHVRAPLTPPPMNNHGKYVASLNKLVKWLASKAAELGVQVFPETPGQELLYDGDRILGVRAGDKGLDKTGNPKPNYEPGPDLLAKVTVLGEGPRGTLAKQLTNRLGLYAGKNPQVYSIGIKELWQMPKGSTPAGQVIHTLGQPLDDETFGGGFIYSMADDIWDIGFVVGLDYKNPLLEPHAKFQEFKAHPSVAKLLEGGQMFRYGAKAIPEGGWFSMPRPYADGVLLVGDSAGFLNPMRLKGVHLAMKSGMLAAETAFEALLAKKFDAAQLSSYKSKIDASWAKAELWAARNFHQGFEGGLFTGMLNVGLGMITGGRGFGIKDRLENKPGHAYMKRKSEVKSEPRIAFDGVLTFDKLTDVFKSGTMHDENQPCHLHVADTDICANRCTPEYGNPCQHFCPANVYEPMFEQAPDGSVRGRLQINFANCVHCKTCDIADPYQIITWVPPQGGEGPVYTNM